ncbi:MAG: hypothetical protein R6V02_06175 [Candidatus Aminicenantes bacterium]
MKKTAIPILIILIPILFTHARLQEDAITVTLEKASYSPDEPLWGMSSISFNDAGDLPIICPPEWQDLEIATILESKDYRPVSCLRFKNAQGEQHYVVDTDADFDFSDEQLLEFQTIKNMSIAGTDIQVQPLNGGASYTRRYEIIVGRKGKGFARIAEYRKGVLRLDNKEYSLILRPVRRNQPDFDLSAGTQCLIDLDHDGDFSLRWRIDPSGNLTAPEQIPLNSPFIIADKKYQATDIDRHGTNLVIEPVSIQTAPSIGFKAPDFEVVSFDNQKYRLEDFKGQTILMEFWSPDERFSGKVRSWVEYIVSKYGDQVTVLSIMINPDEAAYGEYLEDHTLSSLAVRSNDNLQQTYNPGASTPAFYVIDKTGTIRFKGAGLSVIEVADTLLENIL